MGDYFKLGNIYKPADVERRESGKKYVTRLEKENNALKNRCRMFTNGALCAGCDFNCEVRAIPKCIN